MQEDILVYWLWLVMVMGFANKQTVPLLREHPDIIELYSLMQQPDCTFLNERQKKHVRQNPLSKAKDILELCRKKEMQIITCQDALYPERLLQIYNPPAVLFCQGKPEVLRNPMPLTVVGTRHPSEYSIRTTKRLCSELAEAGCMLISGGALGLDSLAHQAALEQQKPTVSVMGCGLDCNYPKGTQAMKEEIKQNGVILSEYFPGMPPYSNNFPVRNRILSALSPAVLVTEANRGSGCMITANLACEQGKTVFCIPPADIYNKRYSGQAILLRDGAFCVCSAEDILQYLSNTEPVRQQEKISPNLPEIKPEELVASVPETDAPGQDADADTLSEEEELLLRLLSESEKNTNMLCCLTGFSLELISMHLFELEEMGWIRSTRRDFYTVTDKYHKLSKA